MNITIVTIGTRGDVQPYLALALGLQGAGHSVTICTHETFRSFVESDDVSFAPLAGDIRAIFASEQGRRLLTTRNPAVLIRKMTKLAAPILRQITQDIIAAAQTADLILGSTLGYFNAMTAAEVHGIPLYLTSLQWFTPTSAFASTTLPPMSIPFLTETYNRLSYPAANWLLYLASGRLLNQVRKELTGLPPLRYRDFFDDLTQMRRPVLYGFSALALSRPPEWNKNVHVTGFWFLNQTTRWQPPVELAQFLASGPPPVYIGFGSMSDRNPEAVGKIVLEALRQTGQRGILLSGWEGLKTQHLSSDVLLLENVPHHWLFPQMAAVIHHGGIGTTAEALRAGVPQIIVPFTSDQPFWGQQMHRIGAATPPVPRKRLSAERLAAAIQQAVGNSEIRQNTQQIGNLIRAEDGVGRAVDIINQWAADAVLRH